MADGAALPKPVSFIRSMPALAELRSVLSTASSASGAAKELGIDRDRLADYCRLTSDEELRSLYRACVQRGKHKASSRPPAFAVLMWLPSYDEATGAVTYDWLRIWACDAANEDDAMQIALRATGRSAEQLKVKEERK